ncbi:hypothetical protein KC318_g1866 [Hortaea werneckii]|nr:hypothetical protein KC334_g525 [Hortaea werneckii]KAI7022925.1 hypothetical protein KC355_g1894 [Hortaea werneckii]KAI7199425.1 hypothetical protein KC324_g3279 [Hortaea werneckii]KAI7590694.1 hypothetical protein KC316_g3253 [Hortaea werneckii]KAI7674013.1 hypothetical protein KC318_g1866 [Hortaea werneckii]
MSSVDDLYRVICSLEAGYPCIGADETWCVFRLTSSEYDELHQRIQGDETLRGYYEDKIYYDWESPHAERPKGKYILRQRGSNYEEYFKAEVKEAIRDELKALALRLEETGDTNTARELSLVRNGGSPPLELSVPNGAENNQRIQRSPDVTFFYNRRAYYPALVAEFAYPQQGKSLKKLAHSYIVGSRHRIGCMIGFDLPKRPRKGRRGDDETPTAVKEEEPKAATVSVWRCVTRTNGDGKTVGTLTCDLDAAPFRSVSGDACDGALKLDISDLLPHSVAMTLSPSERTVCIPFAKLSTLLNEAEDLI